MLKMTQTPSWLAELLPLAAWIPTRVVVDADSLLCDPEALQWLRSWLDRLIDGPELLIAEAARSLRASLSPAQAETEAAERNAQAVRYLELEFYDAVMIRFARARKNRQEYDLARFDWRYYRLDTSRGETGGLHQVLLCLSQHWQSVTILGVRVFFAGLCDVYVCLAAARWNTPNFDCGLADAEDVLRGEARRRAIGVHELASRPSPQRRWQGDWRGFSFPGELERYARERLARSHNTTATLDAGAVP